MFGLIPTEEAVKLMAIRKLQCDRKYKKKLARAILLQLIPMNKIHSREELIEEAYKLADSFMNYDPN